MSLSELNTTITMPVKFTVVGTVSSVEPTCMAIVLDVAQKVVGSPSHSDLAFFACLGHLCLQMGSEQFAHLPIPNTVVTFTSNLLSIDGDMALLNVDSVAYIPCPRRLPLAAVPLHYYHRMLTHSSE